MSETIVIRVGGVNITNKVLFGSASFESQMGAVPGTFELTVKDDDRDQSYQTGDEVTLDVGSRRLYGGFLTMASEQFAFGVVDSTDISQVTARQWVLRGVDYNILFDKRILRNLSDLTHHLGTYPAGSMTGALIRDTLCPNFLDLPGDLDFTTLVRDVVSGNPDETGAWKEQGSTWRQQMEDFARWGAIYYINADKQLVYTDVEDTEAKWQFSDRPNNLPIPSGYGYAPTTGFRELEVTEDASQIANDAFVWGGSEWSAGIRFARRVNTESIDDFGRWQYAETRFNDLKSQAQVDGRANVIVNGDFAGTGGRGDGLRGLVFPNQSLKLTYFDRNVPADPNAGGAKAYLRPGDLLTFILYALGTDLAHPYITSLPMRSQRISFPNLDPDGLPYLKFEATFGLQISDPWYLWKYLRDQQVAPVPVSIPQVIGGGGGGTTAGPGANGTFVPTPDPNGTITTFAIEFAYIPGTSEVYVNGIRVFAPTFYTESDPTSGEITFLVAPAATDKIYVIARLAGGTSTGGGTPTPLGTILGFGANVTGGTGQASVVVSNLNDSGAGSLRDALGHNRTITFSVGGNIDLSSRLILSGLQNITIDGSTAPAPGITIRNHAIWVVGCNNVILTNFRSRQMVSDVFEVNDNIWVKDDSQNIVLDHLSTSGFTDESIDISVRTRNVTIQWCFICPSRNGDDGAATTHNFEMLFSAGGHSSTVHHNLFYRPWYRAPNIQFGGGEDGFFGPPPSVVCDVVNNLIWEFGYTATGVRMEGTANARGNYYRGRSGATAATALLEGERYLYQSNNRAVGGGATLESNVSTPFAVPTYAQFPIQDPVTAALEIIQQSGCRVGGLDAEDSAAIAAIQSVGIT